MNDLIPQDPSQADPSVIALMHGMKAAEGAKGNYDAIGDQGTAAGIGQWSNQVNGVPQKLSHGAVPINFQNEATKYGLNPQDFSPENQNKVLYAEVTSKKKAGLTPEQILSAHNSGDPNKYLDAATSTGTGPVGAYDVKGYVDRGMTAAQKYAQQSKGSTQGYQPPAPAGQMQVPTGSVQGYAPPTPPQHPGAPGTSSQGSTDPSGGFISGLQEDLSGTNPESLGTQAGNAIKGVGNFLFPIAGDAYHDIKGDSTKTALQQAGDLGSSALSAATLIPGVGEGILGLKAGLLGAKAAEAGAEGANLASKSAPGLLGSIGKNAALGGAYGAAQGLGSGATDPSELLGDAAIGAGGGVALGAGGKAVSGLVGKSSEGTILQKAIQDSMPLENKATRIDALRSSMPGEQGGVTRKGLLGTSTITPSEEDVARGKAAAPYLKGEKDPVVQVQNLNKGIQGASKATDSFLDQNSAPANFADMRTYMETNHPTSSISKDPAAMENYARATQEALDMLYTTMKDSAKATGDFSENTTAASIRKARIAIDQQISKELGENTFGSPQYKGIKAAEIDTRNLLNRMSEDMLRYPGQLANLNKLNELISASRTRGIEVEMNNPEVRSQLEKQFGLTATQEGEAAAQKLADAHKNMSQLYEARDNIIDKYQRKIGKNKIQEAVSDNPVAGLIVNTAKRAVPFGIADHVL